jgi:hypothetical protein
MYVWLRRRSELNPRLIYNDISGDSGHSLGGGGHRNGRAIDVLQFHKYPGARTGGENFVRLRRDVVTALTSTSPANVKAAKERVTDWVAGQRRGIRLLMEDSRIERLLVGRGLCHPCTPRDSSERILPDGWLELLLVNGRVESVVPLGTRPNVLNVGGSLERFDRVFFRSDHDDHNHIRVKDAEDVGVGGGSTG